MRKYINILKEKKFKKEKITMLTAYDYITAKIIDESSIDIILVGDSYGMVKLGYETTLPVTLEEMLVVSKAVSRGIENSILVVDMPFLSCNGTVSESIHNCGRVLKETKAQGVKIESSFNNIELIKKIVEADIPVMGHIGLTPQSIYKLGGYKIQGKTAEDARKILDLAYALEAAGVFAVVLEGITEETAKVITEKLSIPTIGIGAGKYCDGQVLVIDDILGMNKDFVPKHTKVYANLYGIIKKAVDSYKKDVEQNKFPKNINSTKMDENEFKKFLIDVELGDEK